MITQASICKGINGGALIVLEKTGMDLSQETTVSVENGRLRVGQRNTWFVSVEFQADDGDVAAIVRGNPDISIVEADGDGFEYHTKVMELRAK